MKRTVCLILSSLALLMGAVKAADVGLDMDLMQQIEDTNKSLASNIALQDAQKSRADAEELHRMFIQVEAHFLQKGDAADAVDLSKKSKDLAQDIAKSVQVKRFDEANESSAALSRTCRACHTFYKQS